MKERGSLVCHCSSCNHVAISWISARVLRVKERHFVSVEGDEYLVDPLEGESEVQSEKRKCVHCGSEDINILRVPRRTFKMVERVIRRSGKRAVDFGPLLDLTGSPQVKSPELLSGELRNPKHFEDIAEFFDEE